MLMRSRSARGIILTRYAMRGFEFGKEFLHVSTFALLILYQALANAFASVGEGGDVEQQLSVICVEHGFLYDLTTTYYDRFVSWCAARG